MIPADSFYARLAQWRDVLVDDADYAPLYKDSPRGRPSIPPSMVVLAMLLEYHDDCSDAEAEQKMRFDLRWKHALGLGLEEAGFDATVLCRFRHKLLERELERNLFERLVKAARGAGLNTKDAAQLLDRLPHSGGRWGEGHLHSFAAPSAGSFCALSDTPPRAEPGFRSGSGGTSTLPTPRNPRSTGEIRRLAQSISIRRVFLHRVARPSP